MALRRSKAKLVGAAIGVAVLSQAPAAFACDGKSHSFTIATGENVTGGGLVIRLDKAKLLDDDPDKYTISVKDDGKVLADHIILHQYDSATFSTRCGTLSIGAGRKSMFSSGTVALKWSYF